jgi:hypothetical protein
MLYKTTPPQFWHCKWDFAEVIKGLEMGRLSWIIWVGQV